MNDGTVNDFSEGINSPQQHVHIGANTALSAIAAIFGLLAFGAVIAACILLPTITENQAKAAAAPADVNARIAEREARIAQDKYSYVQSELAKKGIFISTDGH